MGISACAPSALPCASGQAGSLRVHRGDLLDHAHGVRAGGDQGGSVVIVDRHEMFATVLRMTLSSLGLDAYQAPTDSRNDVLDHVRGLRPRVAVLDLNLGRDDRGRLDGVELVRPLCGLGCAVVVLCDGRDHAAESACIAAGAVDLIPKTSSLTTLLDAVRAAGEGRVVMPEQVRQAWLSLHDREQAQRLDRARVLGRLSTREREVLDLLVQGHRAAAVAAHFVVSMTTVRTQIRAILAKLDVTSQLEAAAVATQPSPPAVRHGRRQLR